MKEIAILDFGSQYTHLIARAIRELGVVSHIYPNDTRADSLRDACGIILSGGPKSVTGDAALPYDRNLFDLEIPILGLCYGHQLIAKHFGGSVTKGPAREYGLATLRLDETIACLLTKEIPGETEVWMSHGDHVDVPGEGFVALGATAKDKHSAVYHPDKKIIGLQFHPEVHHTTHGKELIANFLFHICRAEKNWSRAHMLTRVEEDMRREAGNKKVFLLMSGGVDSTVCFALLKKTLGKDRVYGFHVDHGFMRQGESAWVTQALADIGLDDLHVHDASHEFFEALEGVVDPEQKRRIIGNLFLDITERAMKQLGLNDDEWLLGQGTIYPDTIESGGTRHADKIKTHHNRVDRVQKMIEKGLVIEPIKELYKDEVREIGLELGLPHALIYRHPFPGPGLAIRCLCSNGSDERPTFQTFADQTLCTLPIRSVGVQGDERTYAHPAVLLGGMRPWDNLRHIPPSITNTISTLNRVLITLAGDEEYLAESTTRRAYLGKERIQLLQRLDKAITDIVLGSGECGNVWQMPVVLIPFGHRYGESLVIRPATSREVMTLKFAELPRIVIEKIKEAVMEIGGIDFLFYDITNKPPGTMEWE